MAARFTIVLLAVLAAASPALAQSRVVIADFSGAGSGGIRNQAVRGLSEESGIELVASDEFVAAGGLDDLESAASSLRLSAVVEGVVVRRGRRWTARLTVRDPSGEEVTTDTFVSRNLSGLGSAVRRGVRRDIAEALRAAEPAAPEEQEPETVRTGSTIRAVVRPFDGPGAGQARAIVVSDLTDNGVSLVETSEADSVAERLGVDLGTPDGRVAVATELRLNAWIDGEVERRGRRSYTATVRVTNGLDGFLVEEASYTGRNARQLVGRLRGGVWDRLGAAIEASRPPPAPSRGGGGGGVADGGDFEDEGFDGDEVSRPSGPRPPAFRFGASIRILSRSLSYNDDLFGQLRQYELNGAPALGVAAQWYPAAHFTGGLAASIGLDFRGEVGIALQSADSSGVEYPTDTSAWSLGARMRLAVDEHEIAPLLHYGTHSYAIEAATVENPKPDVPDVDYEFIRLGVEGAFVIVEGLSLHGRLAWLQMLSAGEIETDAWFPRLSVGGIEAAVGVGYALAEGLEVQAGVDLRRYYFTMSPEPGDPWIAGGAVDQYLAGAIGVSWVP